VFHKADGVVSVIIRQYFQPMFDKKEENKTLVLFVDILVWFLLEPFQVQVQGNGDFL
jgi:hypothetical protein